MLFRSFYEMFFDDALTASKELEITLTGKDCGLEECDGSERRYLRALIPVADRHNRQLQSLPFAFYLVKRDW